MFDPPKVRKVKILKLLWVFFRRQFAYFCLFWHLNRPRLAAQWVRPNFFGPEGGQTIPPHHSIAKYLKNLKSMSQTGTFILGHCVKLVNWSAFPQFPALYFIMAVSAPMFSYRKCWKTSRHFEPFCHTPKMAREMSHDSIWSTFFVNFLNAKWDNLGPI